MVPDLALAFGRYALTAYAAAATILTTACIALHAVTAFDRRAFAKRSRITRDEPRSLFVSLEPAEFTAAEPA